MFSHLFCSSVLVLASLPWQGVQEEKAQTVPKLPTPAAQLAHAKKVKAESRGTKGAARVQALEKALHAYQSVRQYWPKSGVIAAEAAFRRGEIQRTLGRPGLARGAFQEAIDQGTDTVFVPRSLLEIGHLHRRAAEFDQSILHYRRIQEIKAVPLRYLNDSREWLGKVYLELEQWQPAATSFREWATNAESPIGIVRAVDLEALAWVGAGDLEQANLRVQQVRQDLEGLAEEPTKEAAALAKALERMKAPAAILAAKRKQEAEARAKAGGTAG